MASSWRGSPVRLDWGSSPGSIRTLECPAALMEVCRKECEVLIEVTYGANAGREKYVKAASHKHFLNTYCLLGIMPAGGALG